jgi:putative FmdB family regulatory protein
MPTYDYQCPEGHTFEIAHKMSDKPRVKCPTCGKPAVRQISGGAALIFKGSGFYITDYGKDGKGARKAEPAEGVSSEASKTAEPKASTEKTPAAGAESKAATKPGKDAGPKSGAGKKAAE